MACTYCLCTWEVKARVQGSRVQGSRAALVTEQVQGEPDLWETIKKDNLKIFKFNFLLCHLVFCLPACLCTTCTQGACRVWKRALDPLELVLQLWTSLWVLTIKPGSFGRVDSVLSHLASILLWVSAWEWSHLLLEEASWMTGQSTYL